MTEKYALGIQTFSLFRENNAIYVDKTSFVYRMVRNKTQKTFFLSRPRRFGKSLFLTTLESFFEGKKELFEGLYIYDKMEWETYPIIRLSFDAIGFDLLGLSLALSKALEKIADEHDIRLNETAISLQFQELIVALNDKYKKQVVILIDEYDKPIVHGVEINDVNIAEQNRDIIKSFFSILKNNDEYIRFLFITGVSKFTKGSIFSDLNHLTDLTFLNDYATICGYTEKEIKHYFPNGLKQLAKQSKLTQQKSFEKIKDWYNGFSWNGKDFVYNPFSFMHLLNYLQFKNYWFESGTPTILIKLLKQNFDFDLENIIVGERNMSVFDLRKIHPITLMLQTGYLTLKKPIEEGFFEADFPNHEVRLSFQEMLLSAYSDVDPDKSAVALLKIRNAFERNDIPEVMRLLDVLFAQLPYQLFKNEAENDTDTSVHENFYHAIIFLTFKLLGIYIDAEVSHREGRIDAKVETKEAIYIFEFKRNRSKEEALKQMKSKQYALPFALSKKDIYIIGVNFEAERLSYDYLCCKSGTNE